MPCPINTKESMKLRTFIRFATITSIALLCIGFIAFSFFRMSIVEKKEEFNLYSLIPANASAVFETTDIVGLVQNIDEMDCSKDQHYLPISRLFATLKDYLNTLLDDTPHGLSRQMNKMLFSFHEPDNDWSQVLYCSLGTGDYELLERFVDRLNTDKFPAKVYTYKGEDIHIYPLPDGSFMACYITSRFLVLSFQKNLIEEVIDAYLTGASLTKDPFFIAVRNNKKKSSNPTVYTRMYSLDMGKDDTPVHANLANWTEFEMKMNGRAIYFSGVSHDPDTCQTFLSMLRKQEPLKGFPNSTLPESTFFFCRRSVSNMEAMQNFTDGQGLLPTGYIGECNAALTGYLKEQAGSNITTCLFLRDEEAPTPAAIISIPVYNISQAEQQLHRLLETIPTETNTYRQPTRQQIRIKSQGYTAYVLPPNTLFAQLAGTTDNSIHAYACFYKEQMLITPDVNSLSQYIECMEEGKVLDNEPMYKDGTSGLSDSYHFMLIADLGSMMVQPEAYTNLLPSLFFRYPAFFSYFTLSAQFICSDDGVVYPNVVLQYKNTTE